MAAIRSHAGTAKLDGIAADFSGSVGAEVVIAKLPAVDVLVNNVGIFEPKPFTEIPDADCRSTAALWPYKAILLPLNLNPTFARRYCAARGGCRIGGTSSQGFP